ncbi:unnamed protein product [Notodromas monacha]|uniref:Endoplasmic reticulum resident protein 29 n=1 Tax=Notodromas monacha TaxID=399045 RepID=A0A7R9C129_9CRUS|nr:unnamed protein product [Notodromas monacha]CAG0923851.1 unnamed protein product [Notodromas monacha]
MDGQNDTLPPKESKYPVTFHPGDIEIRKELKVVFLRSIVSSNSLVILIAGKFRVVFVKFDVAYPYGEKHENFAKLADAAKDIDDVLIAEVPVKDYGEKENEDFAKKFGVDTKNFPQARLFLNADLEHPIKFEGNFEEADLRQFLKSEGRVWIGLPDCVEAFDALALEFTRTTDEVSRQRVLARAAEAMAKEDRESAKKSAETYIKVMQKMMSVGDDFVGSEEKRIKKLLAGKITDEKKKELKKRMNILLSFLSHQDGRDELSIETAAESERAVGDGGSIMQAVIVCPSPSFTVFFMKENPVTSLWSINQQQHDKTRKFPDLENSSISTSAPLLGNDGEPNS